jgi:hypothetical protein
MAIPYRCAAVLAAMRLLCGLLYAQTSIERKEPQLALWLSIKRQLAGPGGADYFESGLKGAQLPALRGTVLSTTWTESTSQFVLNLSGGSTPEVVLRVTGSTNPHPPERGSEIQFAGVPLAFTREPFMLTMETEEDDANTVSTACGEGPLGRSYFGPPLGTARDGRYRHDVTRVRFDRSPAWCVQDTQPSSDGGEIAVLVNSDFQRVYAAVWMKRDKIPPAEIPTKLQAAIPEKVGQRAGSGLHDPTRKRGITMDWRQ